MHKYFADWYSFATSGQSTAEQLKHRWAGVEKLKDGKTVDSIDLVRLAFRIERVAAADKELFRQPFKDADPTFLMSGNDVEVSVLAGSTIAVMLEKVNTESDKAALSIAILGFQLNEVPQWCQQFLSISNAYLSQRLLERREVQQIAVPTGLPQGFKQSIDTLAIALAASNLMDSGTGFTKFGELLIGQLNSITKQTSSAIRGLQDELRLRREECEVLWWLTSRISRDLDRSFDDLDVPSSVVVLAKELADLIKPPGALATKGILTFLLSPMMTTPAKKQTTISAALKNLPDPWLTAINDKVKMAQVQDLCPVLGSLDFRLKGDKWENQYKLESGIDAGKKVDAVELAYQVHRECLLVESVI